MPAVEKSYTNAAPAVSQGAHALTNSWYPVHSVGDVAKRARTRVYVCVYVGMYSQVCCLPSQPLPRGLGDWKQHK